MSAADLGAFGGLHDDELVAVAALAIQLWSTTFDAGWHALVRASRLEIERRSLGQAVVAALAEAP